MAKAKFAKRESPFPPALSPNNQWWAGFIPRRAVDEPPPAPVTQHVEIPCMYCEHEYKILHVGWRPTWEAVKDKFPFKCRRCHQTLFWEDYWEWICENEKHELLRRMFGLDPVESGFIEEEEEAAKKYAGKTLTREAFMEAVERFGNFGSRKDLLDALDLKPTAIGTLVDD